MLDNVGTFLLWANVAAFGLYFVWVAVFFWGPRP